MGTSLCGFLYSKLVPFARKNLDEDLINLSNANCPEGGIVIDFGCSDKPFFSFLKEKASIYMGVDIDCEIPMRTKLFDEFYCVNLCEENQFLPLSSSTVDLVVSRSVFEHLPKMGNVLSELVRILKPGGHIIAGFPNLYYPVFYLNKVMEKLGLRKVKNFLLMKLLGRSEDSIFPAYYSCSNANALSKELRRVSQSYPIEWEIKGFFGGVWYFRWNVLLFVVFLFYEMFTFFIFRNKTMPYLLLVIRKKEA